MDGKFIKLEGGMQVKMLKVSETNYALYPPTSFFQEHELEAGQTVMIQVGEQQIVSVFAVQAVSFHEVFLFEGVDLGANEAVAGFDFKEIAPLKLVFQNTVQFSGQIQPETE